MKQNTKRLSSALISILLVVAALLVYFDFIIPAYQDLQTAKGQEVSQAALLDNEKKVVTQVQNIIKAFQGQSQSAAQVNLALPIGQNISGALAQLYGLAAADNVGMDSISIAAGIVPQAQAAAGNIVKPMGSVTFQLTVQGTYENFKTFLKDLETNIRIFDVKGFSVHPGVVLANRRGGTITQDNFIYNLTIATYYQLP